MNWKKLGLIFKIPRKINWVHDRTWVPTIDTIDDSIFKVYFGGKNKEGYTQTGYFVIDINDYNTIIEISPTPVIALGSLGSFDDSLALACSLVDIDGIKYMYYVGWMKGNRVRYYPSIGLAISKDKGKSFQKYSNAPLIERTNNDPYGMASPFVLAESTGWKMWYASYRKWELRKNEPWPTYELRFAESSDGINWNLSDKKCIGSDQEEAVARPYVIKEQNLYRMWFTYRKKFGQYKIGYADSSDGINWNRLDDEVGITTSDVGWDADMICYPCVFRQGGNTYMFYNGNNFGGDGIGLAILE